MIFQSPHEQVQGEIIFFWIDLIMNWEQGQDLNLRPSGYEPDELPDCSTLLQKDSPYQNIRFDAT